MYIFKKKFLISIFPIIAVCFFVFTYFNKNKVNQPDISSDKTYLELSELKNHTSSFDDLRDYFQKVAKDKGGEYAFEVLKRAEFPPNTDMHLLGHAVGDILYQQKGLEGITVCTDDFRNACSHSIVVGLFSDRGDKALPEIAQACRAAPGGSGAYTMCFHGLGHGILAAVGYSFEKAIPHCSSVGTKEYSFQEKSQCISGMIMEIISGGGHDHEIWVKQRPKYLNVKDSLAPCNKSLIPDDSKYLCYNYLTPFLFESVGADIGNPQPEDFKKAFRYCDNLPKGDMANRDACFGGFGKEFVALIQNRDIRKNSATNISDDKFKQVYEWCKLAGNKDGTAACLLHVVSSLYWGGENDVKIPVHFCSLLNDDGYYQGSCYRYLIGAVHFYIKDNQYIKNFCEKLPTEHKDYCLSQTSDNI